MKLFVSAGFPTKHYHTTGPCLHLFLTTVYFGFL